MNSRLKKQHLLQVGCEPMENPSTLMLPIKNGIQKRINTPPQSAQNPSNTIIMRKGLPSYS
jgi:hypothetical protein